MTIEYKVPFYGNTPDNKNCFPASLKMTMKYFQPEKDYTWEELAKIIAKVEGLGTWDMAGLIWLMDNGYDVRYIGTFDYERFAAVGEIYLFEKFGEEVGKIQIQGSNIPQERKFSQLFAEQAKIDKRTPDLVDIEGQLQEGYLVICNVNGRLIHDLPGYSGHFVLVIGYDEDNLILHDPGLPAIERRIVSKEHFHNAWAYPTEKNKGAYAVKL